MIIIVLLLATALRIIGLDQSLWLDEAININNAAMLSFKSLFFNYSLGDFHPPLYHLVIKAWVSVFGISEPAVRTPSILFAIGTIYLTYLIGRKIYDQKTGIIAALLLATAPLHIYYSQEARMYMMAAFFTTLSIYFFLSIFEKDKLYNWLGFIISTTLLLYTDYLPYLLIIVYGFYILVRRKLESRHTIVSFIPALVVIFTLLIPWLILFPQQLQAGQSVAAENPAWSQVVGQANVKNFFLSFVKFTIGRISNDNNLHYGLLFAPVGFFVSILFGMSLFRISSKRLIIYAWFFIPIILAFAISFFIPVFSYFRFIFVLSAFYLIWASAINTVNIKKLTIYFLVFALLINFVSTFIYLTNPKYQRENWQDATNYILSNSNGNTIVLFESSHTAAPFDYYNKGLVNGYGALDSFNVDSVQIKKDLPLLIKDKDKIFLFQYLSGLTDPNGLLFQQIINNNFKNTDVKDFSGVGFVYEFNR